MLFGLLKSAVCILCPINCDFLIGGFIAPVDPISYSLTPGHSGTPFDTVTIYRPFGGPIDPWGSVSTTLRTCTLHRPSLPRFDCITTFRVDFC